MSLSNIVILVLLNSFEITLLKFDTYSSYVKENFIYTALISFPITLEKIYRKRCPTSGVCVLIVTFAAMLIPVTNILD